MINSPTVATHGQEDALGWMLLCVPVTVWVRACDFKVITPPRLSRSGRGEVTYPDFLTHYHITSPCHPFFPLTFLSLAPAHSLSLSLALFSLNLLSSKRADQIVEVTFSLVKLNHAYQFSSRLFLLPINLFSQLTCEGCMKANEGKQEIISNIKIPLSKGECPFEMLYFSAGLAEGI